MTIKVISGFNSENGLCLALEQKNCTNQFKTGILQDSPVSSAIFLGFLA